MQVAAIEGPRQARLITAPDPTPKDDIVVVKVLSAPMCTEYHAFRDGQVTSCLGHEAAGVVVAVDRATRVKVGDRVVVQPQTGCGRCSLCRAGDHIHCAYQRDLLNETGSAAGTATYAQFLLKPEYLLTPVPDDVDLDTAAMACCGLGPTFGAMERMGVMAFDTVIITGMGPVGMGGVINAKFRGARVLGVESHPYRATLALDLGAEAIVNPRDSDARKQLLDLTDGLGADAAVETSGTADAKPFLLDVTRARGQVAFVGWGGNVSADTLISKGLTVHGVWHYNLNFAERALEVAARSGPRLHRFITHTFPMSAVAAAWELQLTGECGKVVLHPWD